jgi:hypothetical protein
MAQADEAVVESPNPMVTITMAERFDLKVSGVSTVQDMALVVVSTPLPTSSPVGYASSSQRLEDDVILEFDAIHHLSKLTGA